MKSNNERSNYKIGLIHNEPNAPNSKLDYQPNNCNKDRKPNDEH